MKKASAALELAGFRLNFKSDQGGIISVLRGRYGRFVSAGGAAYRFEVFEASGGQNPFKPAISLGKRFLKLKRGDFEAVLDMLTGAGTLKAAANERCLDAFLRSFISFLLIRSGGFMLHSAGLVKNGKAHLFLGKSGAGKSTLCGLATGRPAQVTGHKSQVANRPPGCSVISDELNLIRFEKGRFRVYGSPFWGEMRADGRPGAWPLGGVFLLKKAETNRLSPCSKAEALKWLLRCLVNFSRSPEDAALIMKNSARLLAGAGFSRLEFTKKDAGFLNLDW
ncbi:MAG: hypothetical protein HY796_11215 [Elusimicrobia bacterium]|nr:hypothetical protein [Elusimicrobiota bacterium]